jgi:predicted esterase
MARIHEDAPPFFLIHGDQDTIIPVREARHFRQALEATSRNPVVYSEIQRAGHAFDLVDTSHARRCAVEATRFLDEVRARHSESRPAAAV